MADKSFFIDTTTCTACRGCQVACKQWNKNPATKTSQQGSHQNPADLRPLRTGVHAGRQLRQQVRAQWAGLDTRSGRRADYGLNFFFFQQCHMQSILSDSLYQPYVRTGLQTRPEPCHTIRTALESRPHKNFSCLRTSAEGHSFRQRFREA